MRTASVFVAMLTVFAVLPACDRAPVAMVNGKAVDAEAFDRAMKESVRDHNLQGEDVGMQRLRRAVLFQLVTDLLVIDEATKAGIRVSEEEVAGEIAAIGNAMGREVFRKMLRDREMSEDDYAKQTRERMIIGRFRESLREKNPVTEEQIRSYYRNSQKPFIMPARILAKMIEMDSREAAAAVLKEMRGKKISFDDMAARLASEGRAAVIAYGWVKADFFSPEIAQGLLNLRPGRYGGPYKGRNKVYLIMVKKRERERIATFAEVREDIRKVLTEQRKEEAFARWLDGKKKTSAVEISLR